MYTEASGQTDALYSESYLIPSTKIFFTFTSLVFGDISRGKRTKYEFKRDVD